MADTMRERLGAEIVYLKPVDDPPGCVEEAWSGEDASDSGQSLLILRLWGEVISYDGGAGWSSYREFLDTFTPANTPDIPQWPQLVAETIRDQLGGEILYVRRLENVPGRVY